MDVRSCLPCDVGDADGLDCHGHDGGYLIWISAREFKIYCYIC